MIPQFPIPYLIHRRWNLNAMTRWTRGLPSSCPCSPWLLQLWKTLARCPPARPMIWATRRSNPRKAHHLPSKESGSIVWATRIKIANALLNSFSTRLRNSTRSPVGANKPWCVAFAVRRLGRSPICGTTCVATSTTSHLHALPADVALPSQVTETVTSRKIFALQVKVKTILSDWKVRKIKFTLLTLQSYFHAILTVSQSDRKYKIN